MIERGHNCYHPFSLGDQLVRKIPSMRLREMYFTNRYSPGVPTSSEEVDSFFCQIETALKRIPSPSTRAAIKFHQTFRQRPLSTEDLNQVQWYFDPTNPRHISWALTNQGKDRSLWNAASNYLGVGWNRHNIDPWREDAVLSILSCYQRGSTLPPVILSSRPYGARPDGHIYILDGVHRLLSLAIHILEEGNQLTQEAFIT